MKKKTSILLVLTLILTSVLMAGCGGGGATVDEAKEPSSPFVGKWVGVVADAFGVTMEVSEFTDEELSFDIQDGGKVVIAVDGEKGNGTWTAEDNVITFTIEGEELKGTLNGDTLVLDDFMDSGIAITYGREGTEAADPTNYFSEEVEAALGSWKSESFREVLDTEERTDFPGVDDIADAVKLEINPDHSAKVTYKGEDLGETTWSAMGIFVFLDYEEPKISIEVQEDGRLRLTYSNGEDYYDFFMVKEGEE